MTTAVYTVDQPSTEMSKKDRPQGFYAPELDVLRFVAFMLVFGRHVTNALGAVKREGSTLVASTHASSIPPASLSPFWMTVQGAVQSLDFGVCLFFFLSSFLITRLLLIERERTGTIAIRNFYVRRSLRIWPLYFTFLALIALASNFMPFLEVTRYRMWAAVFFVSNWAAVLHGWSCVAIQPLWSVSIEEQFYILWPNFARFGRKTIVIVSLGFVVASMATLSYMGQQVGSEVTQTWPNTLVQCLFLAGGALTACLSTPENQRTKLPVRLSLIASGFVAWIVASTNLHIVRTHSPGSASLVAGYLLVLLGTYFIFSGVVGWNATPVPVSLRYLGKISYGLYVFHSTCLIVSERIIALALSNLHLVGISAYVMEGVSALLALAMTLCLAALSYKYLESPFLRLKERFTVVPSRAA